MDSVDLLLYVYHLIKLKVIFEEVLYKKLNLNFLLDDFIYVYFRYHPIMILACCIFHIPVY